MPQAYVAKLAKEHNITTEAAESKWSNAKAVAAKQGKGSNYAYITSIFKSMMHETVFTGGFKDFLRITEGRFDDESFDRGERGDRFEFGSDEEFDDGQDNPFQDEDELGNDDEFSDDEDELGNDDEFSDDEDEFGDDSLEHKLAAILNPEELDDADEFDDQDHPRDEDDLDDHFDDEGSDELEDDFEQEGSDDRYVDPEDEDQDLDFDFGMSESFSILKDLMLIEKAKKPLKKAAKAVYHRDYVKTAKKPYRKYHPETEYTGKGDK